MSLSWEKSKAWRWIVRKTRDPRSFFIAFATLCGFIPSVIGYGVMQVTSSRNEELEAHLGKIVLRKPKPDSNKPFAFSLRLHTLQPSATKTLCRKTLISLSRSLLSRVTAARGDLAGTARARARAIASKLRLLPLVTLPGMLSMFYSVMELVDAGVPLPTLAPIKQTITQVEGVKVTSQEPGKSQVEDDP